MSKKLVGSAAVYMSAEMVNKAVPFFLLPFLTAFLSPSDFGVVATYQAVLQILFVFIGLSLHAAISVLFFKQEVAEFHKTLSAIFIIPAVIAFVVSLFVLLLNQPLVGFLQLPPVWVATLPIVALFQAYVQFLLIFYQVRKKQAWYVVYQLSNTVLNIGVSVILIAQWGGGLEGRLVGISSAAIIFGLWAVLSVWGNKGWGGFMRSHFEVPLRFSLPLIPHALSGWIKSSADKMILMAFWGAGVVGEYAVMYQVASILSVAFMAINKALVPYLFGYMKREDFDPRPLIRWSKTIVAGVVAVSGGVVLVVPIIFELFVGSSFKFDYLVVTFLVLGFMFQGLYLLLVNFFMFYEKTKLLSKIAVINTVAHLGGAVVMVHLFGGLGGAITSFVSWGGLLILLYVSGRNEGLFPWGRIWQS